MTALEDPLDARPAGRDRLLLALCAVAVAFAAVDTYVVVLALPDMMAGVGIPVDELQRAAPIVSGFLLGYVAMLPLIGRIADLRGQVPVLAMSLVLFAIGSFVTAISYDLPSMVAGRFLQGVGGGGLVPATMSLVAALYPVERRGLPLGLVSAVQEFGSVLGPLFGALVLSFTTWRGIFAINLAGGAVLLVAVSALARARSASVVEEAIGQPIAGEPPVVAPRAPRNPRTLLARGIALLLLAATVGTGLITFLQPPDLQRDLTWGQLFIPYVDGGSRWVTPIGVATIGAFTVLALWCWFVPRALVDLRGWFGHLVAADLLGATLLAAVLGGIVLAFATADPEVAVFSPQGPWFLAGSALALVLLLLHLRRAADPIVPRGALRATPAWGSLVVSFLVGWALIAALVDIPLFARTTTERDSQLGAALVLLRFLAALPVGAIVGGWLLRRVPAGVLTAIGMAAAGGSFLAMAQWDDTSLAGFASNLPLVVGGFGFGLALAPVNAAILATTDDDAHGLASALVVVARMVGMLVGISALTTIGLRRLYAAQEADPGLSILELGIVQEHAVFVGAAFAAFAAGVLALVVFARARTRGVDTVEALRVAG
ncbi:MFS family permease [Nocardioides aromaticivorans]|uniref:MFS family permease n=1 Tax=Nocardioides aromaticivorans TaxID=200618 RepID=A0A7Y9ZDV8_9ACTN|nr:MFS transporter [Nocardioides aromaticivorans]NYI43070.1 MFS family permease [Nocardioides aromaticivorans]